MTNQQIESAVSHPAHYTQGTIEAWDFIADWRLDYLRGSAVKYITRAGHKQDNPTEQDLRKALAYLNKALENGTYPREVAWGSYKPKINPVDYGRDKGLPPQLAAAIVLITQWDIAGAIHFVTQTLDAVCEETVTKKAKPPVVYGTDEKRLADNRTDKRVFEFGKRMGEKR